MNVSVNVSDNVSEESGQQCPICHAPVQLSPRYPHYLCRACGKRITDAAGRQITLRTISQSVAGAYGEYEDGSRTELEAATPYSVIVYCDGVRCQAQEAYMGGIVIEPAARV